ncbi:MAG TPA: methionine ABC transporter substrate-binding protein [Selenomonas sp.]|nr:MetQ/NlpA family ABC transporter substrate-binding protein [Selenomonadaceae bacterium]HCB93077.1 methionine ABC transporter substrate-binding protein [Selenomonas sp.]
MKKIFAIIACLTLSLCAFAGCGSQSGTNGSSGSNTIKVGATPVPHAEILETIKPDLEKEGFRLEIIEFNDYVQPNLALNDKELDANFFQHEPYLKNFIDEHKELKLKNAAGIHVEPMGIYSKKFTDLKALPDGASIAIPNDPTNGGRALLLLEKAGLLKLKNNIGEKATVQDIEKNPMNFQFREVEAAQVPRTLEDVDAAVINTNYAMQVNLVPTRDALFMEDRTSPYVNIIAIREGDENRPEIKALIKALKSDHVKKFIEDNYKGAIVAAF